MSDLKSDDTGNAIVPVLACVLQQLCLRNDRLPLSNRGVSKFHALRPPAISIKDYLLRVAKYAACSGECFVLALVYIDRIIQSNSSFVVNSLNIHRLLITSIMLAAKFFDDQYFNNAYYAKVGGVPCTEINSLEVEFLFLCNFALFVNTDTYSQYYTELCNHAANTSNMCACSQGPRVPQLIIPHYPLLSQPPLTLEGNVLFPVQLNQENNFDNENDSQQQFHSNDYDQQNNFVNDSIDNSSRHSIQSGQPASHHYTQNNTGHYHTQSQSQQQQHSNNYYEYHDNNNNSNPSNHSHQSSINYNPISHSRTGSTNIINDSSNNLHRSQPPNTNNNNNNNQSDDQMMNSPQVGVM